MTDVLFRVQDMSSLRKDSSQLEEGQFAVCSFELYKNTFLAARSIPGAFIEMLFFQPAVH